MLVSITINSPALKLSFRCGGILKSLEKKCRNSLVYRGGRTPKRYKGRVKKVAKAT